jgi:hypothetical protein
MPFKANSRPGEASLFTCLPCKYRKRLNNSVIGYLVSRDFEPGLFHFYLMTNQIIMKAIYSSIAEVRPIFRTKRIKPRILKYFSHRSDARRITTTSQELESNRIENIV